MIERPDDGDWVIERPDDGDWVIEKPDDGVLKSTKIKHERIMSVVINRRLNLTFLTSKLSFTRMY